MQNMRLLASLFQRLQARPPWGPNTIASTEALALQLTAASPSGSTPASVVPRAVRFQKVSRAQVRVADICVSV